MTDRARTVFLGTGPFAVPVLSALAEHPRVDLRGVVTAPPRPGSRGRPNEPPVARWAAEHDLAPLRPERLRAAEAVSEVRGLAPDLLVLADYGQIVPASLLDLPRHGALNLHPSLLPRHRGATPVPSTILAGERETGVTLIRMDTGVDTGPIVAQWRYGLSGRETAPELEDALAEHAARLLAATLDHWLAGKIEPQPQPDAGGTITRTLRRTDGRLDPSKRVVELERQVRAYQPWPGSYLETSEGRIVVWRASISDFRAASEIGAIAAGNGSLALAASDGMLVLEDVQPAGGRRMTGAELLRGRPALAKARVVPSAEAGA